MDLKLTVNLGISMHFQIESRKDPLGDGEGNE